MCRRSRYIISAWRLEVAEPVGATARSPGHVLLFSCSRYARRASSSASVGIGTIEETRGSPLGYLPAISTVRLPSSIAIAIRRR